jgi:hypothetical protein
LAVGAQADIVAFSFADPRVGVTDDPIRSLLMNGNGRDAVMTIVAGRIVMQHAQVPGIDLVAIRRRAQGLFERMRAAYSLRDYLHRSPDQLFPSSFPQLVDSAAANIDREGA